jgi:hypothetical protein
MVEVESRSFGIDTKEDLERALKIFAWNGYLSTKRFICIFCFRADVYMALMILGI